MAETENAPFKPKAASKQQLAGYYGVSMVTFRKWLRKIHDLGTYDGKAFTPAQVQKIIEHLGPI